MQLTGQLNLGGGLDDFFASLDDLAHLFELLQFASVHHPRDISDKSVAKLFQIVTNLSDQRDCASLGHFVGNEYVRTDRARQPISFFIVELQLFHFWPESPEKLQDKKKFDLDKFLLEALEKLFVFLFGTALRYSHFQSVDQTQSIAGKLKKNKILNERLVKIVQIKCFI